MTEEICDAVFSKRALAEFEEALGYIHAESPRNAVAVANAITGEIEQLRRFPASAPIDRTARVPPEGADARVAHASGYLIRYAFPLRREGEAVLYVVSIRRAARQPLDDTEYGLRLLQELAGLYAIEPQRVPA